MGMIMKDGIPYGGIYPIDDAPTQGSNNAVKSGGVFSSLSNKVDKIAGKGLSTNDYDNTEKEQNEANAEAIEAIVNVNGCCNVFAIDNPISLSDAEVVNNGIINTDTDTANGINLMFRAYVNGSYVLLKQDMPLTIGNKVYDVTIPNNATKLQLKHNGLQRDISIEVPTVPVGNYKLVMTVVGVDPSVIGGFEITNIMLYDARLKPTGYVHYAMTNRELTERVTWKHLGYGADDGGEVATSINYSEFMFTMNIADINIMQSIIVPRDQIYHAIYLLAYQDTVHHGQTRIDFNSSLSKFTFQRESLNGWNAVRIDVYGR